MAGFLFFVGTSFYILVETFSKHADFPKKIQTPFKTYI